MFHARIASEVRSASSKSELRALAAAYGETPVWCEEDGSPIAKPQGISEENARKVQTYKANARERRQIEREEEIAGMNGTTRRDLLAKRAFDTERAQRESDMDLAESCNPGNPDAAAMAYDTIRTFRAA